MGFTGTGCSVWQTEWCVTHPSGHAHVPHESITQGGSWGPGMISAWPTVRGAFIQTVTPVHVTCCQTSVSRSLWGLIRRVSSSRGNSQGGGPLLKSFRKPMWLSGVN